MASTNECVRNVEVEVPAGEVEREATRIAQGIQKRAKIPGFRPGKAPLSLVRQHFSGKIREETIETLVPAHLKAVFERDSLEPVSTPTLEHLEFEPGSPLKFKASFEVMPPFELGDYRAVRTEMPPLEVGADEIDAAMERLRQEFAKYENSAAPAVADGHIAVVEATTLDQPDAKPQELPLEVGGKDTMAEFSEAVKGMKPGEEREAEIHYPADYPSAALAGQTRRFQLKLKSIQDKVVPELTDAWAQQAAGVAAGDATGTVAGLRERVGNRLRAEREHEARHKVEEAVLAQLTAATQFPVPEALVDKQIEHQVERNLAGLARQGVDPRRLKLDWNKLRERHQEGATRDVRASLILDRIAEREKIDVPPEAVEAEIAAAAAELRQTPEAVRARWQDNGSLRRIEHRIRTQRVLDMLCNLATQDGFAKAAAAAPAATEAARS